MGTELKQLIIKRGVIKGSLTRFDNYLKSLDINNIDLNQLKCRKAKFELLWEQFEEIQLQIEIQNPTEDSETSSQERTSFESLFFELESDAQTLLQNNATNTANLSASPSSNQSSSSSLRLPVIELPKFTGSHENWYDFFNTFVSLIHSNHELSNIQKFQYLKSCLQGNASHILTSVEISDANYDSAWSMLKQRYDNKRLIISKHVQCILDLPSTTKENFVCLREILDGLVKHVRILKSLDRPVDSWDDILIQIVSNKLDATTIKEWETTLKQSDLPELKHFIDFLSQKCNILETLYRKKQSMSSAINKNYTPNNNKHSNKTFHALTTPVSFNKIQCVFCNEEHPIYQCSTFLKLSIKDRLEGIKKNHLCINCLRKGHSASSCRSGACRKCNKGHNTLLHFEKPIESSSTVSVNNHSHLAQAQHQVLLSTALIYICDSTGKYQECRALLDSGSQSSFITQSLVDRLKIKVERVNVPVTGISQAHTHISSRVNIGIKSRYNAYKSQLKCLVLNNITNHLPLKSFKQTDIQIPKNIKLADPHFNVSSQIDLLVGAEIFWDLLCVGQIKLKKNQPILQKTNLGWIISGKYIEENRTNHIACCFSTQQDLDNKLSQFWNLEEYSGTPNLSHEEQFCENHFKHTFKRNSDGRFIVKIPLKENSVNSLGESKPQAVRRFHALERKFAKDSSLKTEYTKFINEYLSLNHMRIVPISSTETNSSSSLYLPHHAVMKQSSTTTKLRVVFDGSARSTTGISLNDIQMVGPVLQQDLLSIIIRFRTHKIALTADIAKMYRQVLVDESETCLQRIVWRENPNEDLQTYELLTVTYGTASASFLAIRSLHQLALAESQNHPISSEIALRDFYVDDLLSGASTIQEATTLQNDISKMLMKGGFELRKWVSNCSELTENSSTSLDTNTINLNKDNVNTLGLQWNTANDIFNFSSPNQKEGSRVTKRTILSYIAQIFDPLGLIGPIITKAKLIMQKLWQLNITWDESVPISIFTEWNQFKDQLNHLELLSIPRWIIGCEQPVHIELHGFSDASEQAYGACIYIRVLGYNDNYSSNLICSKSRVAPLKNISLPKLELCGALLLARLMNKVKQIINLPLKQTYYWTDSTIVLTWIKATARTWKTFVANRVGEIQDLSEAHDWHHVSTTDNPADVISRGESPEKLLNYSLWWSGPNWLKDEIGPYINSPVESANNIPERRAANASACLSVVVAHVNIFTKYSSFTKLLRITALCLRFIKNIKIKLKFIEATSEINHITTSEINNAKIALIKIVQQVSFARELHDLKTRQTVHPKSHLLCLNPFIDGNGIIRVGGRLRNASLPYSHKHQIILPKVHKFTKLMVEYEHKRHFHSGVQLTLAAVRKTYWPLGARDVIRQVVHKCITCFKANPKSGNYIMGDLPANRVTPSRPFANVGIDYFGPLFIREGKRRNAKTVKSYGAVFVCFSTKAVHLELVTDLSTDTFLAAMKRFMARRGKPSNIYSDNGTNFIGANRELEKLREIFTNESSKNQIFKAMSEDDVTWHFIPPRSPHFGGIWEAAVKSTKQHLRKILGNASLTYEEMYTLLVEIEAILNSRPLVPISNDPNDFSYLTPGHFLIGDSLTSNLEPDLSTLPINRLSRWQHLQYLQQHFWTRWSKEYLANLQTRNKWKDKRSINLTPGQLVLIREDNTPPLRWLMGRIDATHPGPDGVPRVATVRTSGGLFRRPVLRLCPLPIEDSV